MKKLATLILAFCLPAAAVDLGQVEKDLAGSGAAGWVHGAVKQNDLFVFTVRNPENFFDYVLLSLVTDQPDVIAQLASLARHDKVLIKGKFLKNPSPQKHVEVAAVEILKKHETPFEAPPYEHETKLPDDLLKSTSEVFLVHAIAGEGHILVTEYKDAVVPIFVKNVELTKNLSRNDIVRLQYKIQSKPSRPTHIVLDEDSPNAVKVIESIGALHGKPAVIEGALIMFPKSPEIIFNVFAIEQALQAGLKRQYTLVNFDNQAAFKRIREKLQQAWDKYPGDFTNARNKFVSRRVRVRATGIFNQIDKNQANPQVLVTDVDSIEIL